MKYAHLHHPEIQTTYIKPRACLSDHHTTQSLVNYRNIKEYAKYILVYIKVKIVEISNYMS
jgi:hypothetical protein